MRSAELSTEEAQPGPAAPPQRAPRPEPPEEPFSAGEAPPDHAVSTGEPMAPAEPEEQSVEQAEPSPDAEPPPPPAPRRRKGQRRPPVLDVE